MAPRRVDAGRENETPSDEAPSAVEIPSVVATEAAESTRERLTRYARTTAEHAEMLRDRASDQVDRFEAQRGERPLYDIVFSMRDEDERTGGRELAAATAYRLFFLMLPLVLVVVGGLGITGTSSVDSAADAVRESGASAAVAQNIAAATGELAFIEHVVVLVIGVFGTYFAGRGLVKTLSRVNEAVFSMPRRKPERPTRVMAYVLGLLVLSMLLSSTWNTMRSQLGVAEFLLVLPAVGVLYAVVIVTMHAQLPRPDDVTWRDLIPGGLLIGIWVAAMQAIVLGYVAQRLWSSNELYGGIGTAIVLLFWLYLLGRALVLGPVLDAVLWRRRRDR